MNHRTIRTTLIASSLIAAGFISGTAQAALTVGVSNSGYPSSSTVNNGLTSFGYSVIAMSGFTASSLSGLDAVVFGRYDTATVDLTAWVQAGGTLITEWSGANYGMSLLGGVASDSYGNYLTGDPVTFTAAGISAGLGGGLGTSYSDGGSTEFFQNFNTLGSGTVYATRASSGAAAIVGGAVGSGFVWVNGYDWGDYPTALTFQLLDNQITAVPEAETYAMMLAGLGLVGFMARRRKQIEA